MLNALSIDVEENFHASEVQESTRGTAAQPARAPDQTRRVLNLLEKRNTKATFFIVGEIAETHPALVREIAAHGHEIGCHSHRHRLVHALGPAGFRADTKRAVAAIQDACGIAPILYRAPSYSITAHTLWALEILVECGFRYDSSICPVAHDRYGAPGFARHAQTMRTASGDIEEVPVATVRVSRRHVVPVGGGGYLRLLPYRYVAAGIRAINTGEGRPACIYFHPWELDPDQPRLAHGLLPRLRTYAGIGSMPAKVERLLTEFRFAPIGEVYRRVS